MTRFVRAIHQIPNREQSIQAPLIMGVVSLFMATSSIHAAHTEDSEASKAALLPTIQVSAEQPQSYTVGQSNSSTGLALSLKQTPQSVSVVTRQQLDDKNAQTIGDVLANATGISFKELDNGGRTTYRARGFEISNYKTDGLTISGDSNLSGSGSSINMDLYDHVSIVRGANGLLGGTGDPSATIDLNLKKPTKDFAGSLTLRGGSWDKKGIVGDINLPLTAEGDIRSRFVVSGEDSDSFRERETHQRLSALASLEIDASDDTTIGLGYQYDKNDMKGGSWGSNIPIWFADGSTTDFSRKFNPTANWSKTERESNSVFIYLDSELANNWKLNTRFTHTENEVLNNYGIVKVNGSGKNFPHWNQEGTGAYLNGLHSESENKINALAVSLSGPFNLLGRTHELMLGFTGSETDATSWTFNRENCSIEGIRSFGNCQYRIELPVNWRTFTGNEYANFETHRTGAHTTTNTTLYGGYMAARFNLMDDLSLITGVRRSNYKTYQDSYAINGAKTLRSNENSAQVWTPYYGLVYDLTPTYSIYASYTDVFTPQTQKDISGAVLDPITGESYEMGIKGAWFNDNLNASLAIFRSKLDNVAISDGTNTTPPPDENQAYYAGTGRKTQGFETEISGALTPAWNLFAGYTYLSIDDPDTANRPDPRHLIRFNTTYDLSDVLVSGLSIGTGMSWQSHIISSPNPGRPVGDGTFDSTPITVKGYALFDAMARYKMNENLSASLNISNLFDKTYYREYGFYNGLIYGEPRRATISLQARF